MNTQFTSTTPSQLRDSLLAQVQKDPGNIAPIISDLWTHTACDGIIDPNNESTGWETWGKISGFLAQNKLHHLAADVAQAWYDRLTELQAPNQRLHKGAPAYLSAIRFLELREPQHAFWFCTMAFIEDVLSHPNRRIPSSAATQTLRIHFRQTDENLEPIVSKALEVKTSQPRLWLYPETTAVHLAREQQLNPPATYSNADIRINRLFLKDLIDDLAGISSEAKKKSLEFLASYLAMTLPGARIKPNVKTSEQGGACEHELDLVVTQYATSATYLLEAMGRHFLVECKNWDRSAGVGELNHFVAKMRFHRCKCGVIFSKNGLSGDKDRQKGGLRFARLTQLRWYHQDECTVIVIDGPHLSQLAQGSMTFTQALLQGYESVKFSSLDTN